MTSKKPSMNGFSLYMCEVQKKLTKRGIKMDMSDMPYYCKEGWEELSTEEKKNYRVKAKKIKNQVVTDKYTSIGEKVEDVKRQLEESKLQSEAMYLYIEELVRVEPSKTFLCKHKFILIHVNSYSCDSERFYFPAEIALAEFSLERGLIRNFHQLVGFNQKRSNAPNACMADINKHAMNNHFINAYNNLSINYTAILLKIIGFIINKEVDEDVLNDPNLDIPPIYTAHSSTGNELMITNSSLFQLYQSAIKSADKSHFNRLLSVYHLDKLFMEMKNISYNICNSDKNEKALPSVAMATSNLMKDMCTVISIGCNFHENLERIYVCSNYYICRWIHIISTHCCQYFNIKFVSGCHYDFNLVATEISFEESIKNLHISKHDYFLNNSLEKKMPYFTSNSFSALSGGLSTIDQPEKTVNTNNKITSKNNNNCPPLGNSKNTIPKNSLIGMTIRLNEFQLNETPKKWGGKEFNNVGRNKQ